MTNNKKKTNGKIKRTFAAALAAVMMMSTAATIAASAADTNTVVKMNTTAAMAQANVLDPTFTLNSDLLKTKNVTTATIFKVLEGTTEYGKYFTPALGFVTDLVFGPKKDPTQQKLDEINDKIDKLFERIDTLQDELVNSFGNQLGIQNFYDKFVAFKSQVQNMRRKINEISTDTSLTQLEKIAKIGSLAGSYNEWDVKFENVLGQLNELINKPSFTQKGNIFELTYNHFCGESMFSGEAIDKAKPLCDSLMQVYIAGTTTITECLAAQYYVTQLPDEYKDKIDSEYKSHICQNAKDILGEIESVNKNIVSIGTVTVSKRGDLLYYKDKNGTIYSKDTKCRTVKEPRNEVKYIVVSRYGNGYVEVTPVYDIVREDVKKPLDSTYKKMYDNVMNRSRRILVNKHSNGEGYEVSSKLYWKNHSDNPDGIKKYTGDNAAVSVKWFNKTAGDPQISFDDVRAMAKYCLSKGITVRTLLNSAGIDTSAVPKDANIITSYGIDETTGDARDLFCGTHYSNGCYKGINIDQLGAMERKIKLVDAGYNGWKNQNWAWAPGGAFCWLTK
ncbi:MAG: hypothetical protein K6F27_12185 [Ruminococcus sp.]|nr:hypothetical protein [Ruminococcus sp.]